MSKMAVCQVCLSDGAHCEIVPDSRSSCTEGSVSEVGPRLSDVHIMAMCSKVIAFFLFLLF